MSALRRDQFLASAALVFILAAPVSALGQQTEPRLRQVYAPRRKQAMPQPAMRSPHRRPALRRQPLQRLRPKKAERRTD